MVADISQAEELEVLEEYSQENLNPTSVTNIVRSLRCVGRKNSSVGETNAQLRRLPAIIAPRDRSAVGTVQ